MDMHNIALAILALAMTIFTPTIAVTTTGISQVTMSDGKVTVTVDPKRAVVNDLCKDGYRPQEFMARLMMIGGSLSYTHWRDSHGYFVNRLVKTKCHFIAV